KTQMTVGNEASVPLLWPTSTTSAAGVKRRSVATGPTDTEGRSEFFPPRNYGRADHGPVLGRSYRASRSAAAAANRSSASLFPAIPGGGPPESCPRAARSKAAAVR